VRPRVALATCDLFPQLAEGDPLLLAELRARGLAAEPAVWDDETVDWSSYDLVIIRSTWDYPPRREQFVGWAHRLPRVLNSADVIRWNTDKRYLAELPHAVATGFLEPGDRFDPPDHEYVIKPAISAGSRDTARYHAGEAAEARRHAQELLGAGRTVMIQPYLSAVDEHGETALMFFNGVYSHAIRKGQLLRPGWLPSKDVFVSEQIDVRDPSPAEREVAEEILDALPWPRAELLYARIDLIAGSDGRPRLIELELTEPSLFIDHVPAAAVRLVDAVLERL
jgi:glutathione synthase/RimK-type ligase-like ATP-grasp enzyme